MLSPLFFVTTPPLPTCAGSGWADRQTDKPCGSTAQSRVPLLGAAELCWCPCASEWGVKADTFPTSPRRFQSFLLSVINHAV